MLVNLFELSETKSQFFKLHKYTFGHNSDDILTVMNTDYGIFFIRIFIKINGALETRFLVSFIIRIY